MPRGLPASSLLPSSTIPPPRPDVPRVLAVLDLSKPEERTAHDLLLHFCGGSRPTWRLLGMLREGSTLRVAVEWVRRRRARFAVVDLSLTSSAATWRSCMNAAEAIGSLGQAVA